jgi:hypothetical protein
VGLAQETPAKESFRQAIDLDGAFRPPKADFPDRVLRVFEAERQGKTKSVLARPNTVPKKAGIGGVGIGLIAAGAALAVGGTAVALSGGNPTPSPTPPTTLPTPNPNSQVTLVSEIIGSTTIRYVNADPPPGSTITGCGPFSTGCRPITIVVRLTASHRVDNIILTGQMNPDVSVPFGCMYAAVPGQFSLNANEPFDVALRFDNPLASRCGTPIAVVSLLVGLQVQTEANRVVYRINYSLQP